MVFVFLFPIIPSFAEPILIKSTDDVKKDQIKANISKLGVCTRIADESVSKMHHSEIAFYTAHPESIQIVGQDQAPLFTHEWVLGLTYLGLAVIYAIVLLK